MSVRPTDVASHVAALVAAAPLLTPEQRDRLALLFRASAERTAAEPIAAAVLPAAQPAPVRPRTALELVRDA